MYALASIKGTGPIVAEYTSALEAADSESKSSPDSVIVTPSIPQAQDTTGKNSVTTTFELSDTMKAAIEADSTVLDTIKVEAAQDTTTKFLPYYDTAPVDSNTQKLKDIESELDSLQMFKKDSQGKYYEFIGAININKVDLDSLGAALIELKILKNSKASEEAIKKQYEKVMTIAGIQDTQEYLDKKNVGVLYPKFNPESAFINVKSDSLIKLTDQNGNTEFYSVKDLSVEELAKLKFEGGEFIVDNSKLDIEKIGGLNILKAPRFKILTPEDTLQIEPDVPVDNTGLNPPTIIHLNPPRILEL